MGDLVLKKTTTGQITLTPQDVAGNQTVTIPASTGTLSIANTSTSGGIFFGGATSGVLYQDASNLYWDDTNNRLGIGTNSPAAALDVRASSTYLINSTNPTAWVSTDSALTTKSLYTQFNTSSNVGIVGTYTNHPLTFVTNNSTRLTVGTNGNLTFGTADAGIVFNKTGALTNSTLDDYEEGTWTPTVSTSTGTPSYQYQEGSYVKIGKLVRVGGIIGITNSASLTGTITIVLPFLSVASSLGTACAVVADGSGWTWPVGGNYILTFVLDGNSTGARCVGLSPSSPTIAYNSAGVGNTWYFRFGIEYKTAS